MATSSNTGSSSFNALPPAYRFREVGQRASRRQESRELTPCIFNTFEHTVRPANLSSIDPD